MEDVDGDREEAMHRDKDTNRDADDVIATLADRERITDPVTVYDDLKSLPRWWRDAVREFESNDLRPYQPSRLSDGTVVPALVDHLEERYDVEIELKAINPTYDGEWAVFVDGRSVTEIEHRRKPDGYTVYGFTADTFEEAVAEAVEDGSDAAASE